MAKDESNKEDDHDTKRQRVGDPSAAQRQAFNEDMELIRSAMNGVSGNTQDIGADNTSTNAEGNSTTQQQITVQQSNESAASQHAAHQGGDIHQRSTENDNSMDSDNEEGNWMQNYTPHHTRVGADYQVAELPAPPPNNNVASAATISGRVSPTSGGSRDSIER